MGRAASRKFGPEFDVDAVLIPSSRPAESRDAASSAEPDFTIAEVRK